MLSGRQFADQIDNRNQVAIISHGEGGEFAGYISEGNGNFLGRRGDLENQSVGKIRAVLSLLLFSIKNR